MWVKAGLDCTHRDEDFSKTASMQRETLFLLWKSFLNNLSSISVATYQGSILLSASIKPTRPRLRKVESAHETVDGAPFDPSASNSCDCDSIFTLLRLCRSELASYMCRPTRSFRWASPRGYATHLVFLKYDHGYPEGSLHVSPSVRRREAQN